MYIVYINIVIIIFGFWFLVALREIFAASGGLKSRPVCVCLPPHHRHHHRHLDHHCVWYTLVQLAEDIFTFFGFFQCCITINISTSTIIIIIIIIINIQGGFCCPGSSIPTLGQSVTDCHFRIATIFDFGDLRPFRHLIRVMPEQTVDKFNTVIAISTLAKMMTMNRMFLFMKAELTERCLRVNQLLSPGRLTLPALPSLPTPRPDQTMRMITSP